ncbi:ADP-heptose--LPS heptosyltransferase 2 [Planctomycetes bacterium Pla163]|uniref:ADP-heptose--LPS heptosyltransferase 2 n=1 Tax=Rohdeia mirabilis TaxID=2528008 RepID=A0A518D1B7_9BACT|nr:ADP-heptose--LPS heptosyltransferase 2 [Planctomycetes bacterium Pla163]
MTDGLPRGASRRARIAEFLRRTANACVRATERLLFRRGTAEPERVGVWRVGMIGDTLVALPALAAVRAAHPNAELVLFTSPGPADAPGAAELLEHSSAVDRVVRWTREDLAQGGLRELCRRLREAPVDRLYLVPQDRTTPRAELRLLVALRLGGLRDVRGANVTTAHFLPAPLARAHDREFVWRPIATRLCEQVESAIADGRTSGAEFDANRASGVHVLEIDAPRRERALLHLARLAPGGEPLLCLAPGAKLEHKRWPAERFGAVARGWIDRGGRAVVLGGPGDVDLAERIARAAGVDVPSLCGVTDLLESAALLERADVLVSNDTGTMHLGAAVGTPLVAIFSGWDRRGAWDPWCADPTRPPTVLRRQVPCHPCLAPACANRSGGVPACLELSADAVLAAALRGARRRPSAGERSVRRALSERAA